MTGTNPLPTEIIILFLRLALAGLLYWFMFTVLRAMLHDIRTVTAPGPKPQAPYGILEVINPGSSTLERGKQFTLRKKTSLGTASQNDIQVLDDYVSEFHAVIYYDAEKQALMVNNARNENDTYLGDKPITGPVPLTDGCIIAMGNVRFKWNQ